tara:strand:- start:98 stop:1105 length:1008 start_codon:yes stop_codon:yes gene_type:complete
MPTVFAGTNDGVVSSLNAVSNTARNASTGTGVNTTGFTDNIGFSYSSGYLFERAFFRFDTRAISVTPSSATLKIYFNSPVAGDFIVVKAESSAFALDTSKFGSIVGRPATGTYSGNVTDYCSNFTPSATSFQNITLNSTALTDIGTSNTSFNICLLNYTYDYLNGATNPSINHLSNVVLNDFPGTDFDAQLEYVEGSAGRQAQAGGTFTREDLRTKQNLTTAITADQDYEFRFENNLKSMVYFNIEGAQGKDIFNTASLRTTTSDSGSNVLNFISESSHVSFILAGESTSSFFMSSSEDISGNNMSVMATNIKSFNQETPVTTSFHGINMELLSD